MVSELVFSAISQLDQASILVTWRGHQNVRRIGAMTRWLVEDPCAGPGTMFTGKRAPHEFMRWWKDCFSRMTMREERFEGLFCEPHKLIRTGYLISRTAIRLKVLDPTRALVGLTMVGFGVKAFHPYRYCICWRRAIPGLDRCAIHSRSKMNILGSSRSESSTIQATRIAQRINRTPERTLDRVRIRPVQHYDNAISSILWSLPAAEQALRSEGLQRQLDKAPRVRSLLPEDFSSLPYNRQLACLRSRLDPNEWAARAWPFRIHYAEIWLSLESVVVRCSSSTGLAPHNLDRLAQAERLLLQGKMHRQVAGELGVSASHLSHLLRRGNSKFSKQR